MKLDNGIVLMAVGIGALIWWRRGREQPVTARAPTIPLPPAGPASGLQLGTADRLGGAYQMALADLRQRFGYLAGWQETHASDGRITVLDFRNVRGGTADASATYVYEWQPADWSLKRIS